MRTQGYNCRMTLTLPDDPALDQVSEEELRIDLACGLFSSGRVSRNVASRIAGMDRHAFDEALYERNIATFTPDMLAQDLRTIE
jgi:predicted HTH domain antitoxin